MDLSIIGEGITTVSLVGLAVIVYVQETRLRAVEHEQRPKETAGSGMAWSGTAPPARPKAAFRRPSLKAAS